MYFSHVLIERSGPSGHLHVADSGDLGPRGDEVREKGEGAGLVGGLDPPPDAVAAGEAGGGGGAPAEGAVERAPGGEGRLALAGSVSVLK
jgi:hypothetical protein